MCEKESIFISYAWGGAIEKKEWLRDDIVLHLSSKFSVFWDRDSISFGKDCDEVIAGVLDQRPITVLCLCDKDYITSASRVGSGLYREIKMLSEIANSDGVRVIPIILDNECRSNLPGPLAGRTYLDLSTLHAKQLSLGWATLAVASGATQAQVAALLSDQLHMAEVRSKANAYFSNSPMALHGSARTHVVTDDRGRVLLPPQWMWSSSEWKYMLSDDSETFCPTKGVWHWDHWSPSRGMRALGTAACAAFFSIEAGSEDEISAMERVGIMLAEGFLSFVRKDESFNLGADEFVDILISRGGVDVLDRLLSASEINVLA
ncbi:toll/interleukin-1 receptor domain-containing protein [Ralstonia solanacearum]|uniref:toll/interleukin-1 receptor domain-containing protein n=1 Tax=Ralstonia solanacearum TaxID=305 RepID=UPI0018D087CA|nr:toll/interleukin-1 receptor domain-containing protein [Ralstonia solanacearum]